MLALPTFVIFFPSSRLLEYTILLLSLFANVNWLLKFPDSPSSAVTAIVKLHFSLPFPLDEHVSVAFPF